MQDMHARTITSLQELETAVVRFRQHTHLAKAEALGVSSGSLPAAAGDDVANYYTGVNFEEFSSRSSSLGSVSAELHQVHVTMPCAAPISCGGDGSGGGGDDDNDRGGGGGGHPAAEGSRFASSALQQCRVLAWRELIKVTRNPADVAGRHGGVTHTAFFAAACCSC
jgi:hypothetical protein